MIRTRRSEGADSSRSFVRSRSFLFGGSADGCEQRMVALPEYPYPTRRPCTAPSIVSVTNGEDCNGVEKYRAHALGR